MVAVAVVAVAMVAVSRCRRGTQSTSGLRTFRSSSTRTRRRCTSLNSRRRCRTCSRRRTTEEEECMYLPSQPEQSRLSTL